MAGRSSSADVRRRQQAARRRRAWTILLMLVLGTAGLIVVAKRLPSLHSAVAELEYPLHHEDIIRQQAADKQVDPALIAAVIYAESRFEENRTSAAGARGLMQVTPETAQDIARRSGGTTFKVSDLATPQVNISYGTYHLRFLLDHYNGMTLPAVAAYNAGQGNVDRWIADLAAKGQQLTIATIPFPETRAYTRKVLAARLEYLRRYPHQLGVRSAK